MVISSISFGNPIGCFKMMNLPLVTDLRCSASIILARLRCASSIPARLRCASSIPARLHCVSSSSIPWLTPEDQLLFESGIPLDCLASRRAPMTEDSMFVRVYNKLSFYYGLDFWHFRVFLKPLPASASPDQMIRYYIETLCQVVGSEEEALKSIYSVATRHYYAFGVMVGCELADIIKALPNVCAVHSDEYVDPENRRYPWDAFINGRAVPCDDKYYPRYSNEEPWLASEERYPIYACIPKSLEANNQLEVPMADLPKSQTTIPECYADVYQAALRGGKQGIPNKKDEPEPPQVFVE